MVMFTYYVILEMDIEDALHRAITMRNVIGNEVQINVCKSRF